MNRILAQRLRECRNERGITQAQAAIYCDITEKAYQNYELMTRETLIKSGAQIAPSDFSLDWTKFSMPY